MQAGMYDAFVEVVRRRLQAVRQGVSTHGNRCDFGSVTMPAQLEIVKGLVQDALRKGAKVGR